MISPSSNHDQPSLAKATFLGALWNHAGRMTEYGALYATSIVIARGLGVEGNGEFAALISISQLILVLTSFGIETSLNRFVPRLKGDSAPGETRFMLRRVVLLRIALFSAIVLFAIAAGSYLSLSELAIVHQYLLVLLAYASLRAMIPLFVIVLTVQLRTLLLSKINVTTRVIELVGVVILLVTGMTIGGVLLLFVATSFLQLSMLVVFGKSIVVGKELSTPVSPLITFGGIFWINTGVDYFLGRQGDVLFLRLLVSRADAASLYDVAYSVSQLALLGMTIGFAGISLATFSRLSRSAGDVSGFYSLLVRIMSFLTIPVNAFLLLNADAVVEVLYSSHYAASATLIQGLVSFRLVSRLFGTSENAEYILSEGKVGSLVIVSSIGAIVNIGLNLLLIPQLGAMGAVLAGGCGNLAANILSWKIVRRMSGASMQARFWFKIILLSTVASWAVSLVDIDQAVFSLLVKILLFLIVSGAITIMVKPFGSEDIMWLRKIDVRMSSAIELIAANRKSLVGDK